MNKDFISSIITVEFPEFDHLFHFASVREWMTCFVETERETVTERQSDSESENSL